MSTGVISWSQTAASNATADSNVNWAEGQAPSSVNDSARAEMASVAKWRDDISGILVSGGSGTAYTITSNQVIAANTNGMTVQFTPGTTNTGAVTLSVDGQTAQPLRFRTGVDLPSGVLISGSLYQATYRSSVSEWLLHSFDASIYAIPIGGSIDYWGSTAPNSAFVLAQGQAISQATYAALFSLFGTTYNTGGEPGGTFRVPDLVGRVTAMRDAGSARLSSTYFGGNPANLGAVGGIESRSILQANFPSVNFAVSNGALSVTSTVSDVQRSTFGATSLNASTGGSLGAFASSGGNQTGSITSTGTVSSQTAASGGSATPLATVQPTIICNKLLRII